jgi:DNA ligase D-like protein (predicted 3'-phosphoesterase)
MPARDPLGDYRKKRDPRRSPEPRGRDVRAGKPGARRGTPRFVVHKHAASTLHYDLRLEADGVLKSWAVPKGPFDDPRHKRLAVPTEDHPIEYADFEGTIPEGEYGAGSVILWDAGTYENLSTDGKDTEIGVPEAIERGHLSVKLRGKKLTGGYSLIRTGRGGQKRWLLIKTADQAASRRRDPVATRPESVKSGRDVGEAGEAPRAGKARKAGRGGR